MRKFHGHHHEGQEQPKPRPGKLHSVGALPDVLTALDNVLQEEIGRHRDANLNLDELVSQCTGSYSHGQHDEASQPNGDSTGSLAGNEQRSSNEQPQHSAPLSDVVFLRAEAIPEHQMKVSFSCSFLDLPRSRNRPGMVQEAQQIQALRLRKSSQH